MTKTFATVSVFCLVALGAVISHAEVVSSDPTASCTQTVKAIPIRSGQSAARESAFFNVAEKYGIISDPNSLDENKRTSYFKLMQAYSENLVASPKQFCKALVKAGQAEAARDS